MSGVTETRSPVSQSLSAFYEQRGVPADAWHIGPEHPALENVAIDLLGRLPGRQVLEVGVQAGGFAAPVIAAARDWPGFEYTGVDNHAYANAPPFALLQAFLQERGIVAPVRFVHSDAGAFLSGAGPDSFDLILLDHDKPCYPRDLHLVLSRNLLRAGGVVLIHDVLGNARDAWRVCQRVARLHGCATEVRADVPEGLGMVRYGERSPASSATRAWMGARLSLGLWRHQIRMSARHAAGRALRALGLR
ncbi:MAG: hypothetical protein FJW23_12745 [Acidimicrobiia bacterium]|nr:hypothetical protein [Acidimicrobiia bacterium]